MIKRMETENIRISLIADQTSTPTEYDVILTIKGDDHKLSVDELQEIVKVGQHFWDVNNLYQQTSESIAERKRWENERVETPTGMLVNGGLMGKSNRSWN